MYTNLHGLSVHGSEFGTPSKLTYPDTHLNLLTLACISQCMEAWVQVASSVLALSLGGGGGGEGPGDKAIALCCLCVDDHMEREKHALFFLDACSLGIYKVTYSFVHDI